MSSGKDTGGDDNDDVGDEGQMSMKIGQRRSPALWRSLGQSEREEDVLIAK